MWLSSQLEALINQAAHDYDESIADEPVPPSQNEGTAREATLNAIIEAQKRQRETLWKRLHELEDEREAGSTNDLCSALAEEEKKRRHLAIMHVDRSVSDDVLEIQFKEQLQRSNVQLQMTLDHIKQELAEAQLLLESERTVLKECQTLKTVYAQKVAIAQSTGASSAISQFTEKSRKIRTEIAYTRNELITFLETYYPPHLVDGETEEDGVKCDLRFILEDLMNKGNVHSNQDPYLQVNPEDCWSPYIETLIKAGIATYHPQDVNRIRLVDFRL
ncbi:hypothetical protein BDF14DRAFT_1911571 [Spinellus fusiger]|nr:hypothetical protein BDF14DRAFT_1911571 [Spinellus fusiger]